MPKEEEGNASHSIQPVQRFNLPSIEGVVKQQELGKLAIIATGIVLDRSPTQQDIVSELHGETTAHRREPCF